MWPFRRRQKPSPYEPQRIATNERQIASSTHVEHTTTTYRPDDVTGTMYLLAYVKHLAHSGQSRADIIESQPLPFPATTTQPPATFESILAFVKKMSPTPGVPHSMTFQQDVNGVVLSMCTTLCHYDESPRRIEIRLVS